MMYEFDIPDMSCGHCVSTVSKAIKTADPDAVANIDLTRRKATVESKTDPTTIRAALEAAGYPATF
jgi:copper chaperone